MAIIKYDKILGCLREDDSIPTSALFISDENNINKFRITLRAGNLVIDKAITVTGFNGIENTDWELLNTIG
jgi:hypothetical protein